MNLLIHTFFATRQKIHKLTNYAIRWFILGSLSNENDYKNLALNGSVCECLLFNKGTQCLSIKI